MMGVCVCVWGGGGGGGGGYHRQLDEGICLPVSHMQNHYTYDSKIHVVLSSDHYQTTAYAPPYTFYQ